MDFGQINFLFDRMDTWRHLPGYQLERRADIFFSLYLPVLLEKRFGYEVDHILPEFPVRKGTVDPADGTNRSFNIDYLVKLRGEYKVIFVELKTDIGSRRNIQDKYLESAKAIGVTKLLDGLLQIYKATKYKKKYRCLFKQLVEIGMMKIGDDGRFEPGDEKYLSRVVYIQPGNKAGQENVITFDEAAEIIEQQDGAMAKRFSKSLREWAAVKAGKC